MVDHKIGTGDRVKILSPHEIYMDTWDEETLDPHFTEEEIEDLRYGDLPMDGYEDNSVIFGQFPQYTMSMAQLAKSQGDTPFIVKRHEGLGNIHIGGYMWREEWLEIIEPKLNIPKGILTKLFK